MDGFVSFWNELLEAIPDVILAALVLVLAFLVAWLAKKLTLKLVKFLRVEKALDRVGLEEEHKKNTIAFIGKTVYLIVFALFLPGIFEKLGLNNIAQPLVSMMNRLTTYLPNILAAVLLLIIGLFMAKAVKEITLPVFKGLKVDAWLKKIGYDSEKGVSIAEVLSTVIYVLILVPVVIAALTALNIEAISRPAINMLDQVIVFAPRVVIAIAIFFVGRFIAKLVYTLLNQVLASVGLDKATKGLFAKTNTKAEKFSLSQTVAYGVRYLILIFFLVEALDVLQLDVLTNIGSEIIKYMPLAVSAAIIMGLAILLANFVEKQINNNFEDKTVALIAKIAIIVVGVFVTMYQLGIASDMVNSAFIIILSAFAVAFAVSFGVGGRDFAKRSLDKFEKRIEKTSKK